MDIMRVGWSRQCHMHSASARQARFRFQTGFEETKATVDTPGLRPDGSVANNVYSSVGSTSYSMKHEDRHIPSTRELEVGQPGKRHGRKARQRPMMLRSIWQTVAELLICILLDSITPFALEHKPPPRVFIPLQPACTTHDSFSRLDSLLLLVLLCQIPPRCRC